MLACSAFIQYVIRALCVVACPVIWYLPVSGGLGYVLRKKGQ